MSCCRAPVRSPQSRRYSPCQMCLCQRFPCRLQIWQRRTRGLQMFSCPFLTWQEVPALIQNQTLPVSQVECSIVWRCPKPGMMTSSLCPLLLLIAQAMSMSMPFKSLTNVRWTLFRFRSSFSYQPICSVWYEQRWSKWSRTDPWSNTSRCKRHRNWSWRVTPYNNQAVKLQCSNCLYLFPLVGIKHHQKLLPNCSYCQVLIGSIY